MQKALLVYAYAIGSCVNVLLKVCPVAERETYGMRTENRERRRKRRCRVSCGMSLVCICMDAVALSGKHDFLRLYAQLTTEK